MATALSSRTIYEGRIFTVTVEGGRRPPAPPRVRQVERHPPAGGVGAYLGVTIPVVVATAPDAISGSCRPAASAATRIPKPARAASATRRSASCPGPSGT